MNKEYFLQMNEEELKKFFASEQEESSQIEFKRGDSDLYNIYKEICAFANTDGGILIYGAPNEKTDNSKVPKRKYCIGELILSNSNKSEDALLSAISSNISPSPPSIEIKRINFNRGAAFILYVPKSNIKPHQFNGAYYIRVNTMSTPAAHGLVESMFRQRQDIELELDLRFFKRFLLGANNEFYTLKISISNKSKYPARNVEVYFVLTGKISEAEGNSVEDYLKYKLGKKYGRDKAMILSKSWEIKKGVVNGLWDTRNIKNLQFHSNSDHFYFEIHYWAQDVPATYKAYKISKDNSIVEVDLENDTPEKAEYYSWIN